MKNNNLFAEPVENANKGVRKSQLLPVGNLLKFEKSKNRENQIEYELSGLPVQYKSNRNIGFIEDLEPNSNRGSSKRSTKSKEIRREF